MIEELILKNSHLMENLQGYSPALLARMILGAMFGTAIQVMLDEDKENLPDALNAIQIVLD
jgi:L-cystine uptake protein TcyP (sodium:dicarboxylate symporter family)